MSDLFTLLYSLEGRVGRGGYWTGLVLNILILMGTIIVPGIVLGPLTAYYASHHPDIGHQQGNDSTVAFTVGSIMVLILCLVLYSSIVIEIKRWRDRGMSGFMIFTHFLPFMFPLVLPSPYAVICSLSFDFWILAQLGFAGSSEPDEPGRYFGGSFFSGAFILLLILIPIGLAGGLLYESRPSDWKKAFKKEFDARMAAAQTGRTSPALEVTPAVVPPVRTETPSAEYHGTNSTDFARSRVTVGGDEITGITNVIIGPGGRVTVLYPGGGRTFSVTELPQGFLDLWNITPERLKEVDSR